MTFRLYLFCICSNNEFGWSSADGVPLGHKEKAIGNPEPRIDVLPAVLWDNVDAETMQGKFK
jgi:hypothetical protein